MRIEDSYLTPIHGVSTLAPRNRARGQAGLQENLRSDPVAKLTRRPPLKWVAVLADNSDDQIKHHSYIRNGKEYRLIINTNGTVKGFVDNVEVTVDGDLTSYVTDYKNLITKTINDTTIVSDTSVKTAMLPATDAAIIEKVSHINITAALNYGETIKVIVRKSDNSVHTITYTIPDLGATDPDYDTADKARATNQVALEVAARINGGGTHTVNVPNPDYDETRATADYLKFCVPCTGSNFTAWDSSGLPNNPIDVRLNNSHYNPNASICIPYVTTYAGVVGVTAVAVGSSIAIWEDTGQEWLDIEIGTGQGDKSSVAINNTVESTAGLPLYAVHGTRIKVQPSPTSEKGTYYLEAEGTAEGATTAASKAARKLEEVVWSESRSSVEEYSFNAATLPHSIEYDSTLSKFVVGEYSWQDRRTGDNKSCKVPTFIGGTITTISYFQKRMVFVSSNDVLMTETEDIDNWWKASAIQLLVTDPVTIASSAVGIDILKYVIPHNRDLLIIASNGQFKIRGSLAVTPQTVSMPLTTSYEVQTTAEPESVGNSVFLPINYGTSSGLQEYTGEKDTTQDLANQVSHHVIGYIKGSIVQLTGSANLEMLAVRTDVTPDNEIFIYEQFTSREGKRSQSSWSKWILPTTTKILDIVFRSDKLNIVCWENNTVIMKQIDMYSRVAINTAEVYLDDLLLLDSTDGLTVALPTDYTLSPEALVIMGDGTTYPLFEIPYTESGGVITFNENISKGLPCKVSVGVTYSSRYRPTRPFKYTEEGIAITSDRIRINRFLLSLTNTNEVKMGIVSDFYSTEPQVFNSRYVGGLSNKVGEVPFYTGDQKFSFSQDANLAEAEFYCDNHLGMTIAGISWEGQYHRSAGRMT